MSCYTSLVTVEFDNGQSLEGFIDPYADLDGRFTLICADTGETLRVNGWLAVDIYASDTGAEIDAVADIIRATPIGRRAA
jgi:hypothetical protein